MNDLWARRVPHILVTYTITSSSIILFIDWLVSRYNLNQVYTDILLIAIITLIPSIIMIAYFHGRPGKDEWKSAELVGIPINIFVTFICIFVFISPDLLSGDQEQGDKIFKSIAVLYNLLPGNAMAAYVFHPLVQSSLLNSNVFMMVSLLSPGKPKI